MTNDIPFIPEVPPELIQAVSDNNLIVFIGAGVSRIIGGPSWIGLAQKLADICHRKNHLNHFECEELKKIPNPKKIITIAQNLLGTTYQEELKPLFDVDIKRAAELPIYEHIFALRGKYITTNVDTVFDSRFTPQNIKFDAKSIDPNDFKVESLAHMHGSIQYPSGMVLTTEEYLMLYSDGTINKVLKPLFDKHVVLFIGYGVEEMEVLELIVRKSNSAQTPVKKFLLFPIYNAQKTMLKLESDFYRTFGIDVLPYRIDDKGYDQLFDVLKEWNRVINEKSNYQGSMRKLLKEGL